MSSVNIYAKCKHSVKDRMICSQYDDSHSMKYDFAGKLELSANTCKWVDSRGAKFNLTGVFFGYGAKHHRTQKQAQWASCWAELRLSG